MSTVKERAENTVKVQALIAEAAADCAPAAAYLDEIAQVARVVDDLIDGDAPVTRAQVSRMVTALLVTIPANVFFQQHQAVLWSAQAVAWNAYLDANELEAGTATDRLYAHVLRDTVNEVVPLVAFLCGGMARMRLVSRKMRQQFKKEMN